MHLCKKIPALVLTAALLLSGTGCGSVVEPGRSGDEEIPIVTVNPDSRGFTFSDGLYIHFGDGVHSAVPARGKNIAASYRC